MEKSGASTDFPIFKQILMNMPLKRLLQRHILYAE